MVDSITSDTNSIFIGAVHATSGSISSGRWFRQNSIAASLTTASVVAEEVSHRSAPGAAATIARTASESEVGSGSSLIFGFLFDALSN
jgi:hypothetical protein